MAVTQPNPFRIGGIAKGPHFANRESEVARIAQSLAEPGGKLLVYGPRRMGKTSAIARAMEQRRELGSVVARADLSTPSSLADTAGVILREVTRAVGERPKWSDFLTDIIKRVNVAFTVKPDATTGVLLPKIDFNLRGQPLEEQKLAFSEVLDAIEAKARDLGIVIGLVLDEFQEIHRFEETFTEWNLRHVIERHEQISYVLAGSKGSLIDRMLDADRGFYRMFERLTVGPIDADYLTVWMGEQLAPLGAGAGEAAAAILDLGGERTHDRMRLARQTFYRARQAGALDASTVEDAFSGIVEEDADEFLRQWENLTVAQQNVLRALSLKVTALTSGETIRRFALKNSATASQAAKVLAGRDLLVRRPGQKGYRFDNPYFEAWVRYRTGIDMGLDDLN